MDDLNITRELEEIKHALWDLQPTGNVKNASPAYVRGLRDRAAVAVLPSLSERGGTQDAAGAALHHANALVQALGYEVPEEGT